MASLQIRDMPDDLYKSLKQKAEMDHRSLAQEAIHLLSEALCKESLGISLRKRALAEIESLNITVGHEDLDIVSMLREDRSR
jgi:plasmid stability protein